MFLKASFFTCTSINFENHFCGHSKNVGLVWKLFFLSLKFWNILFGSSCDFVPIKEKPIMMSSNALIRKSRNETSKNSRKCNRNSRRQLHIRMTTKNWLLLQKRFFQTHARQSAKPKLGLGCIQTQTAEADI